VPVRRIRKFDSPIRIFAARLRPIAGLKSRRSLPTFEPTCITLIWRWRLTARAQISSSRWRQRMTWPGAFARYSGRVRQRQIEQSLNPQCLSGFGKDRNYRIRRAEVILPVDAGDFTFYDCAYEELLQALGVINDDRSIPWTMFNDDVQMGFFDV
jgi:Protein of unknown function (DUF2927)